MLECSRNCDGSQLRDHPLSPALLPLPLRRYPTGAPTQNHDCENMDMPAVVTPSVHVHVTDMASVGHVVHTIGLPQSCGITPTIGWLYIHMSVTRWDVTPRNACLGPCATVQWQNFAIRMGGVLVSSMLVSESGYVGLVSGIMRSIMALS
jgi:hypothetical protein